MRRTEKIIGVVLLIAHVAYLTWLAQAVTVPLGWLLFAAEAGFALAILLKTFNCWTQAHVGASDLPARGSLDVFLPVVNEPLVLFEETLRRACAIAYRSKTVYVLDDGGRSEIRRLARRHGAVYLSRPDRGRDFKAGNLNFGLAHSSGEFVLVLDADQRVEPEIASELLGHFHRPGLALVSTRQRFDLPPGDFNHDEVFYGQMLPGANADNAAISVGSGVVYRRSALEAIGNFQTWNVVEDLYTSYVFHVNGFETLYVSRSYTRGYAPRDLPTIYKQRGAWAVDTFRLVFHCNPLFERRLSWRQRLHYVETGLSYLVSATCIPAVLLLVPATLLTGIFIVPFSAAYLVLKAATLALPALLVYLMSGRNLSGTQAFVGLAPVYLRALFLSFRREKVRYVVTSKTGGAGSRVLDVWPHLTALGLATLGVVWHLAHSGSFYPAVGGLGWTALSLFWMLPFLEKAFGLDDFLGRLAAETGRRYALRPVLLKLRQGD